jgi:hypothetical protein
MLLALRQIHSFLKAHRAWIAAHVLAPRLGNTIPVMFTPARAKHSKSFPLVDAVSVGVDRMWSRSPMRAGDEH